VDILAKDVHLAFAEPMEQARRKVTEELLKGWGNEVAKLLGQNEDKISYELFFNMDETGDEPRAAAKAKKVVTFLTGRQTYRADRQSKLRKLSFFKQTNYSQAVTLRIAQPSR